MKKQEAFLQAYEACHDSFVRYCSALTFGKMDTEDLIQDVLLSAYRHFDNIQKQDQLLHYLIRAARNRSINLWKRTKYYSELSEKSCQQLTSKATTPETLLDIQLLHQAINRLPKKQRDALLLFEISGFSMKEIAKMEETSEGAIKTKIWRGRKKLSRMMSEKTLPLVIFGITFSTSAFSSIPQISSNTIELSLRQLGANSTMPKKELIVNRFQESLLTSFSQGISIAPIFNHLINYKIMSTVSISTILVIGGLFFFNPSNHAEQDFEQNKIISEANIGSNFLTVSSSQKKEETVQETALKQEMTSSEIVEKPIQEFIKEGLQQPTFLTKKTSPLLFFDNSRIDNIKIIKREICDTCDVLISPKHPVKVQMPNFNKVMSLECDTCETLNWTGKVFIKQDKVVNALIQDKLIKKGKKRIMFTIDDNKILSINRKVIPNHLQEKYTKFINEYLVFEIVD